jgi:AT hook motif
MQATKRPRGRPAKHVSERLDFVVRLRENLRKPLHDLSRVRAQDIGQVVSVIVTEYLEGIKP